jgi:hypothetical protein
MSITLNRLAGLEPPVSTNLTGTTATAVFTPDANYSQTIEVISIVNVDTTNACTCKLEWNDGSSDSPFWFGDVAAGETKVIDNIPIMTKTDGTVRSIKATAENANDLWVTVIASAQARNAPGAG